MKKTFNLITLLCSLAVSAAAAETPKAGDKAPAFEAKDQDGNTWKSADHVGKSGCAFSNGGILETAERIEDDSMAKKGNAGKDELNLAEFPLCALAHRCVVTRHAGRRCAG